MTATAETTELDLVDGPELETGGTTNLTTSGTMSVLQAMAPKRAAAYIGSASLLAAWLASAAGISMRSSESAEQQPAPVPTSGTEALAADVQSQALRLRERMEAAPMPKEPLRNPFEFASRESRRQRSASSPMSATIAASGATAVPEPPLTLVGVAEQQTMDGIVRTAMITADSNELFMLVEGDVLGGRYRVKAVGADAVELTDLVTNAIRQLTLR
jgi:hypothetical protein